MLEHIGTTSRFMTLMSHNFGAIQVLRNAVGGGRGVYGSTWFKVYGSTLFALRGGGWGVGQIPRKHLCVP